MNFGIISGGSVSSSPLSSYIWVTHFLDTATCQRLLLFINVGTTDLVRPIYVVEPYHDRRQLEALRIRRHHVLCGSFRGGVWICWNQDTVLFQVFLLVVDLAIYLLASAIATNTEATIAYLVRGDVIEAFHSPNALGVLQQHMRTQHIVLRERV
jgi:hypothetical protein